MTSVVWGPRSATKRRDSFWLLPPVLVDNPVRVRAFEKLPTRDWLTPTSGKELTVAYFADKAESTFVLPTPLPAAIALDIDLRLEVDSVRGTGLRLRQLFTVGPGGALLPSRFARRDVTVTVVPNKGVTIADRPPVELVGTHPLLTVTTDTIRVDAEFLDVTEVWWGLRNARTSTAEPRGDWYVHPALGGHPDRLRVLAATTPGNGPMLWLAWASRKAAAQTQKVQPLIFVIAPAWLNDSLKFTHKLTPAGLTTAAASGKPLYAVGRFLLSPVPPDRLDAVRKATPSIPERQLWQLARDILKQTVPGVPGVRGAWPEKLLEVGPGGATPRAVLPLHDEVGHRPAGHEAAADDSGKPLLLVYPVGVDGNNPYESVMRAGLAERMKSLVGTVFSAGAVASTATDAPATDELILAGHSSGNGILWGSLAANGADIVKCVTFDAASPVTPESNVENIRIGAARRGKKPFTLVLVTSTNSYGTPADLADRVSKVKGAMRGNPASKVVVLPAEAIQTEFWNPHNAVPAGGPTKNPLLRAMLAPWSNAEVEDATTPGNRRFWTFLLFHEFAAYGGQSLTRTFFREALDL